MPSNFSYHFLISGRIIYDAFNKWVMRLMIDCFFYETDSDQLVNKKYFCLLTIFACRKYYLNVIADVIVEKAKFAIKLKN